MTLASAAVAVLAVVLFAYTCYAAGPREILDSILRLGPGGFLAIVALSGARLALRSLAWRVSIPAPHRLGFLEAFAAVLMGEAVGNLTPLGTVASEPAKAALVRRHVPVFTSFTALIIENLVYTSTVAVVIVIGAAVFLLEFNVDPAIRWATIGAAAGVSGFVILAYAMLGAGAQPLSRLLGWLSARDLMRGAIERRAGKVREFESRINGFVAGNRDRVLPLLALEVAFQLAGVAEVYVTLVLIGAGAAGLLGALVFESAGRVVNIVFRFVPLRVGVDEAGGALVGRAQGLPTAVGVTLGVVRKARLLVWTGVGVLLLLHRGLSVRRAIAEAEAVAPPAT
jgi:hypothetical protein